MIGVPARTEAAPYFYTYIDRISSPDVVGRLETQLPETLSFLRGISEEKSLHRYAPEKWSIREILSHVNDAERVFLFRAFWFARGFSAPLPSYDQEAGAVTAHADEFPWTRHVEEFQSLRLATLAFFHNLPAEAWMRSGTANNNPFTVRALAYILAGHVDHHVAILRDKYL
jgi:hypothetical protein